MSLATEERPEGVPDDYIDAKSLIPPGGSDKRIYDFTKTIQAKKIAKTVAATDGRPPYITRTGRCGHTYMHPVIALAFARWMSLRREAVECGYVYVISCAGRHKIGKATDYKRRIGRLVVPFPPSIVHVFACERYGELEAYLHDLFAARRRYGEWFDLTPAMVRSIPEAALSRFGCVRMDDDEASDIPDTLANRTYQPSLFSPEDLA